MLLSGHRASIFGDLWQNLGSRPENPKLVARCWTAMETQAPILMVIQPCVTVAEQIFTNLYHHNSCTANTETINENTPHKLIAKSTFSSGQKYSNLKENNHFLRVYS